MPRQRISGIECEKILALLQGKLSIVDSNIHKDAKFVRVFMEEKACPPLFCIVHEHPDYGELPSNCTLPIFRLSTYSLDTPKAHFADGDKSFAELQEKYRRSISEAIASRKLPNRVKKGK